MNRGRFFFVFFILFSCSNGSLLQGQLWLDSDSKISLTGNIIEYSSKHRFDLNSAWIVEDPKELELELDENTIVGVGDSIFTRGGNGEITFGLVFWHKLSNSFSIENEHFVAISIGDCKMLVRKTDDENRIMFRYKYDNTSLKLFYPVEEEFRKLCKAAGGEGHLRISVKRLEEAIKSTNEIDKLFQKDCLLTLRRSSDAVKREKERQDQRLDNMLLGR